MPGNAGQRVLPAEQARKARGEEVVGRALGFEKTAQLAPAKIGEHFAVALVQVVFPPHGRGRCEASCVGVVAQDQRAGERGVELFGVVFELAVEELLPGEFVAQLCGNGLVSLVVDGNHGRVVFYKSSLPGDWLIIQFLNVRT